MKKRIYKVACIIFLIIGILLLLDGMTGRIDNNKLYDKKNITFENISEDESIDVELSKGKAKIVILHEEREVRFCEEVSTLSFEPGEAGEYDVFKNQYL